MVEGQFLVTRPKILLTRVGIITQCRQYSAFRDDPWAEAKLYLGEIPSSDPSSTRHRGADRFSKWRWNKIMGGHQSWRGQTRHGIFGRMQQIHIPRNHSSSRRKRAAIQERHEVSAADLSAFLDIPKTQCAAAAAAATMAAAAGFSRSFFKKILNLKLLLESKRME